MIQPTDAIELLYMCLLTLSSLWTCRYCYSQCTGGHITTTSNGPQRTRPWSEAPQTHRAPSRDLCMNWITSTGDTVTGFIWKGNTVNTTHSLLTLCVDVTTVSMGTHIGKDELVVPLFPGLDGKLPHQHVLFGKQVDRTTRENMFLHHSCGQIFSGTADRLLYVSRALLSVCRAHSFFSTDKPN